MQAVLYTDGGARGNPGPAGIGFVLRLETGAVVEGKEYIGRATNNQAEYVALQRGLERARAEGVTEIKIYLDSELVIKQLKGEYRLKNAGLKPYFAEAQRVLESFAVFTLAHVPREKNKRADLLVNKAIDAGI